MKNPREPTYRRRAEAFRGRGPGGKGRRAHAVHDRPQLSVQGGLRQGDVRGLCDAESRERLTLTIANDGGAQKGLDPETVSLGHLIRDTLDDAAGAVQQKFGPGSRYRVVLGLLVGTPHGDRIRYASNRTELLTDGEP